MSYALLPPITMIITTLIAGNLALSLGMIGALSIVRFRNPVKSPLELVIFFALITIGIGIAVNIKLGILMTIVTMGVILGAKVYENISVKNGKKLFSLSFVTFISFKISPRRKLYLRTDILTKICDIQLKEYP